MIKHLYIPILIALAFFSCEDEEAIRVPELAQGANVRILVDAEFSFFDLEDLQNAKVVYDLYSANQNIEEIEISFTYYPQGGDAIGPIPVKVYTQSDLGADGSILNEQITAVEVAELAGLENGVDEFTGGDRVVFTNTTTLTTGVTFPTYTKIGEDSVINIEPGIVSGVNPSYTLSFSAFVGCPSPVEEISGTYTAVSTTYDSNGGPAYGLGSSTKEDVTISFQGPEPFRYRVSSHDAGYWVALTGTEGGSADFFDICGTIIMQPKASFGFGGAADNGGGTYDPETGVITMNWYNSFNDIYGDVVYTPQ